MSEAAPGWHPEILPAGWEAAMEELHARAVLPGFYLAGGTGLALQLGYRRSVDFDLFNPVEFAPDEIVSRLGHAAGLTVHQVRPGTLHLELHQIRVSFLHYPYPLLFPLREFEAFAVADSRDIACTKVNTIAGRGSRRDFVDLYMAAQAYGLPQILEWFDVKYAAVPYNRVHLLKAITYFTDAEREPMPDMLVPLDWHAVRTYFTVEVPRLIWN